MRTALTAIIHDPALSGFGGWFSGPLAPRAHPISASGQVSRDILLRADSHYGTPEVLDLCDSLGLRYVFGLSKNPRLREHVQTLEASTADRYARKGQKLRRFKSFSYAARSWSMERVAVVARTNGASNNDHRSGRGWSHGA